MPKIAAKLPQKKSRKIRPKTAGRQGPLPSFPFKKEKGGHSITILDKTESKPYYRLQFKESSKRREKTFSTFKEAETEGKRILKALHRDSPLELEVGKSELHEFRLALAKTKRKGVSIIEAIGEWESAVDKLPTGLSLHQAIELCINHYASLNPIEVERAVDGFLNFKNNNVDEKYFRSLKAQMNSFSKFFNGYMMRDLSKENVGGWVNSIDHKSRTVNHYIGTLKQFLKWSITMDYLPSNLRLFEILSTKPIKDFTEIKVITPSQLDQVLTIENEEIRARMALTAFAGLRPSEAQAFKWDDILPDGKHIAISAEVSKTSKRRAVEIRPRLMEYISEKHLAAPWVGGERKLQKLITNHFEHVNIKRDHNVLRHSFISYRLALINNIFRVSEEAGNSPMMINQHYKALVSPDDASDWFKEDKMI